MVMFCPVGRERFDDDSPWCPVHFHPTQPTLPDEPTRSALDPTPAPGGAGTAVRVQFAGLAEVLCLDTDMLIGRSPRSPFGAHLESIGWTNVGRHHCILRLSQSGELLVWDLDSSNGTFIDGERLTPNEPHGLRPGETLRLAMNREVNLSWI